MILLLALEARPEQRAKLSAKLEDRAKQSEAAGKTFGLKKTDDGVSLVTFMDYDLRYFDIVLRSQNQFMTLLRFQHYLSHL